MCSTLNGKDIIKEIKLIRFQNIDSFVQKILKK